MKIFIAVLLIAMTTAMIGSNISVSNQLAVAKTFFRELTPRLQIATEQFWSDENDTEAADTPAVGAAPKAQATTQEAFVGRPENSGPVGDVKEPVQTIVVGPVAEFRPSTEPADEVPIIRTARARAPRPELPRAQPLARDEVSTVIQRLGRVSRAVARNSGGESK